MKAAGYIRVSTTEQAREGISLAAQAARIEEYCQQHGYELTLFSDEGVSAGKPLATRPAGKQLLKAVASKEVEHVITVKLDRLFRNTVDGVQTAAEWSRQRIGLHVIETQVGPIDTSSPEGEMMWSVLVTVSQYQRRLIGQNTKRALQYLKQNGRRLGKPLLGFGSPAPSRDTIIDHELAAVARVLELRREANEWGVRRHSFQKIAKMMMAEGWYAKESPRWYPATIRDIWRRRGLYNDYTPYIIDRIPYYLRDRKEQA